MARNVEVGILIKAKDASAAVLKGVASTAGAGARAVGMLGKAGDSAFKSMLRGARDLNQATQLVSRVFRAGSQAIEDTVKKALDFRGAGDAAAKQFKQLGRDVDLVRARIGDALIPVLSGVATAMAPVLHAWQQWARANREMIATKILEWGMKIADLSIRGIAVGALQIARAWKGWAMIVDIVQLGVNRFFELTLDGTEKALVALGGLASALGMDEAVTKLAGVAVTVHGLSDEFRRSGDASQLSLEKTSGELDKLEADINGLKSGALQQLAQVGVQVQRAIERSTSGGTRSVEEAARSAEKYNQRVTMAFQAGFAQQAAYYNRVADLQEQNARAADEWGQRNVDTLNNVAGAASQLGTTFSDVFFAIQEQQMSTEEGFIAMAAAIIEVVLDMAQRVIIASAAQAAAEAGASASALGPVAAAAAASAAFAVIIGFLKKMQAPKKMQMGGTVTGGVANRDSVPVMLMPGERVLTKEQNRQSGGGGGGTQVVVQVARSAFGPPSSAEVDRFFAKDFARAFERAVQDRRINLPELLAKAT